MFQLPQEYGLASERSREESQILDPGTAWPSWAERWRWGFQLDKVSWMPGWREERRRRVGLSEWDPDGAAREGRAV